MEFLRGLYASLLKVFREFATWLWDAFLQLLVEGLDVALSAAATMLEYLPEIPQAGDLALAMGGLPSGVLWFLGPFALGEGLAIIGAAYALRFLIRRLPFVG